MGSAGCEGHHPTTCGIYPFKFNMFHMAFTFREVDVTGLIAVFSVSGSIKPNIPCLSGRIPVATVVQSIGEKGGSNVAIFP
jgi:hypothetical protein